MSLLRRFYPFVLGFVFLWAAPSRLHAQLNRGSLEGVVTDPQGAVVPGVQVVVTSKDTNVSVTTTTKSCGYYLVAGLVPAQYQATFTARGFSPLDARDLVVNPGAVTRRDVS